MQHKVLFITPPFTQLNTPYPATAYLKGFLNTLDISAHQADLGIEVILSLFSQDGLKKIFDAVAKSDTEDLSENASRIFRLKEHYLKTIGQVIDFLQDKNPTMAYHIAEGDYLPEASRFEQLDDLDWAFGTLGIRDKARYLATLYLEDIGDLITEVIDPHFGFSRYAERLGISANSFDEMYEALNQPFGLIDEVLFELLENKIQAFKPTSIGLSVPFPGNLYAAFRCGQYIKAYHSDITVWMGGGYPNTELRSLKEARVFEFVDFVMLDDGEAPVKNLIEHIEGERDIKDLKRAFALIDKEVRFCNDSKDLDVAQRDTGTPDYSDLPIRDYLSVIEVANPMHRLWSDGRWNKLTLAHGCYWGKCTFCDVSLDYIQRYEPITPAMLCDRIEEIIAQTGQNGFHFVDEAAPPALMRDLAIEILRRKLTVVWWTNIRFEQNFTADLCRLLRASGCIAISGGLEVASDRLLAMIKKGVTVGQVAQVTNHFTEAGIMVHAYLMYGFPTQTTQETIDSLEMVRQLFEYGAIQSAFWHRFAMTAHSPVGIDPKAFGVVNANPVMGDFANNDLQHDDPEGADHDIFGDGLRKSLFNYMHGACFEVPLDEWFDEQVPITSIPPQYILKEIENQPTLVYKDHQKVLWLGTQPQKEYFKNSNNHEMVALSFSNKKEDFIIELPKDTGEWVIELLALTAYDQPLTTLKKVKENYVSDDFDQILESELWTVLRENELLIL